MTTDAILSNLDEAGKPVPPVATGRRPWENGLLLMACNLFVALGNYAFQGLIGRRLSLAEYGYANAAAVAVILLSLPVMAASNALVHYVARFRASGRKAELRGLISSSRKWLGFILVCGFILALALIRPLTEYCGFPRMSLVAAMVINTAALLGTAFVTALCTGMGWYARIGLIAVSAVIVKLVSMSIFAATAPVAESAIVAAAVSTLVYAIILFWGKDFSGPGEKIHPWNRNFGMFVLAALASAFGSYGFTQSDVLIAQRNFAPEAVAHYCAAGVFSRAMLGLTGPLLMVFFATRSAREKHHSGVKPYAILVGLYLLAMAGGGIVITVFRGLLTRSIFGHAEASAAALTGRFALLMFFIGTIEVLGNWALASRWFKVVYAQLAMSILYVSLGLWFGNNPVNLLSVLLGAGIAAFFIVLAACGLNFAHLKTGGATLPNPSLEPVVSSP